jgi:hypothetical protein
MAQHLTVRGHKAKDQRKKIKESRTKNQENEKIEIPNRKSKNTKLVPRFLRDKL